MSISAAAVSAETHLFPSNGRFPNNPKRPLILYRGVLDLSDDPASKCESIFARNGWGRGWRSKKFYPFHHYHLTVDEAVGVVAGRSKVLFGGDGGKLVQVKAGDVIIIPAGVSHKNESASEDFTIVGAYPLDQISLPEDEAYWPDICKGEEGDEDFEARVRAEAQRVSEAIPASTDPIFGNNGPLASHWLRTPDD